MGNRNRGTGSAAGYSGAPVQISVGHVASAVADAALRQASIPKSALSIVWLRQKLRPQVYPVGVAGERVADDTQVRHPVGRSGHRVRRAWRHATVGNRY